MVPGHQYQIPYILGYLDNLNISGMYTLSMYEVYTTLGMHIMGYTYLKNIHIHVGIYTYLSYLTGTRTLGYTYSRYVIYVDTLGMYTQGYICVVHT